MLELTPDSPKAVLDVVYSTREHRLRTLSIPLVLALIWLSPLEVAAVASAAIVAVHAIYRYFLYRTTADVVTRFMDEPSNWDITSIYRVAGGETKTPSGFWVAVDGEKVIGSVGLRSSCSPLNIALSLT